MKQLQLKKNDGFLKRLAKIAYFKRLRAQSGGENNAIIHTVRLR
jgi:hypothetical protein